MKYVFTMPAEKWDENNPDKLALLRLIQRHVSLVPDLRKLKEYYEGQHEILRETNRENKLVCNHAKDITDTASSYFIGNPISYKSVDEDLSVLTEELTYAEADETDGDNGTDLSIYGRAYEYIFTQQDDVRLRIKNLNPENTFMVFDDSIEQNELFAVYYYVRKDDTDLSGTIHYIANVLTANYKWVYDICTIPSESSVLAGPEPHYKGEVPIIEYLNNKDGIGDYELQIPLIDAYNALMSDRVTDKEQFIDAILAIYGALLSDEDADESDKAMERLKRKKLLELPGDGKAKAEYITRTFDETGVEVLKKALEQDIHKFSHIPCLTDESFGGNVSGVAMEFKLLGMENVTKIKTRYYRKGLRKRLRIFCNWLATGSRARIDPAGVTAVFSRAMPKNLLEISQYISNLEGMVSKKTLLSQVPFVDDPEAEIKAVQEEAKESLKQQQEYFQSQGVPNLPPEEQPQEDVKEDEEE